MLYKLLSWEMTIFELDKAHRKIPMYICYTLNQVTDASLLVMFGDWLGRTMAMWRAASETYGEARISSCEH